MKSIISIVMGALVLLAATVSFALDDKAVVGSWTLDEAKSAAAPDGNTAGVMKQLTIKADGTFEALYGTQGTWKLAGGKLLVSYPNNFHKDMAASLDGAELKFPAPAMAGKFCYLKRK